MQLTFLQVHFFVLSTNTHHFLPCFVYDMEGTANTSAQVGGKFLWTALMYMPANTKTTDRLN